MSEEYENEVTSDVNETGPQSEVTTIEYYINQLQKLLAEEKEWYLKQIGDRAGSGWDKTRPVRNLHNMQDRCNQIQAEVLEYKLNLGKPL